MILINVSGGLCVCIVIFLYPFCYLSGKEFRETCSGHGKHLASRCKCDKKYYGSRCQYSDECVSDDDCGNQGKCVDIQGSAMPRRQCFCNFGWFGTNCAKSEFIASINSFCLFIHKSAKATSESCVQFDMTALVLSRKRFRNFCSILSSVLQS